MRTKTDIRIALGNDDAIYRQIADYFRQEVAAGKLSPGDRLPAIRALARDLGLDPGTIARAYRELGEDGVIVKGRGRAGTFLSTDATEKRVVERQHERLSALVEVLVTEALKLGFSKEEIETAFTLHLARPQGHGARPSKKAEIDPESTGNLLRFSGSHDLAVELLLNHLCTLYQGVHVRTLFVGSLAGLMALERGETDIAGAHLFDAESGHFNVPFVKRLMPNETVVLTNLVQRMQGLMVAPGNPKSIIGILDLGRPGITLVNRQKGSGTRMLLDSHMRRFGVDPALVKGYDREETTHSAVAAAVAKGQADVGVGAQSAANIARVDFIPVLKERYDIVTLEENLSNPLVEKALKLIGTVSFRRMLSSIPGYDLSETGTTTIVKPD